MGTTREKRCLHFLKSPRDPKSNTKWVVVEILVIVGKVTGERIVRQIPARIHVELLFIV